MSTEWEEAMRGALLGLGAAETLALTRPGDLVKDAELEDFLFGASRIALQPVVRGLREIQEGRCFYCHEPLRQPAVDHFIPWARVPMNAIENLVLADTACNSAKKAHLASAEHVEAWACRLREHGADLAEIARQATWDEGANRVLGVARATYLFLPEWARLWHLAQEFVPAEPARLIQALA